jgi:hypothetical protein
MLRHKRVSFLGSVLTLSCAAASSDPAPEFEPHSSGGAPQVGDSSSAGIGSSSGSSPNLAAGYVPDDGDTTLEPGEACSGISYESERVPLDMYFLVDVSGSMLEPTSGGGDKWTLVSQALLSFLSEPRNADIGVGIGYFPVDASPTCVAGDPGCLCIPVINLCFANAGGSCDVADYAAAAVPLSLPPNPSRVVSDIATRVLAGGTPTRPALEGTLAYVSSWAAANPGRKSVVVLATDGEPTGCIPNAPRDVASIAAAALNGPHRIQTFVIGVGRSLTNLNLIAQAGGTTQAFLTDTSGNLVQELADALAGIRAQSGPCSFEIPAPPPESGALSPSRVNVRYTPPGAGQGVVVARTADGSVASCGPDGGWYYDDPAAPAKVELCDASCAATQGARIEMEFGCQTIVAPPR